MSEALKRRLRCAVYTWKSTDEGQIGRAHV